MSERSAELARRRAQLQQRAGALRAELARDLQHFAPLLQRADQGRAALRWLRAHPVLLALAGAGIVALRPRAALRWGGRALALWRGWRSLRRRLEALRS